MEFKSLLSKTWGEIRASPGGGDRPVAGRRADGAQEASWAGQAARKTKTNNQTAITVLTSHTLVYWRFTGHQLSLTREAHLL